MAALVVDAQPLVALLAGEPSMPLVRARLREWAADGDILISAVNWAEVLYIARRRAGAFASARADAMLRRVPISVVDVGAGLASHAAELKTRHTLGLGDSFAAALAIATNSPLLTGDADFLPLAEHGLAIEWVGEPPT